jgi:hypothetical protein
LPFFNVAILFSSSVVLTLLLLCCLVPTFTSSSSPLPHLAIAFLPCIVVSTLFSSSDTNNSKLLQHISPLRSLSIQTSFHNHISYSKVPSPSSFSPTDFRRSCSLLSYHTIPLVLSIRRTTQKFHQWK